MKEIKIPYKLKKLYFRFVITIILFLLLVLMFTIMDTVNTITILIFIVALVVIGFYTFYKYKTIKALDYFIKCDMLGVYTKESFQFCEWGNIKLIDLRRYMGYQTIFFEVKNEVAETKMKPIHKDDKMYYCIPLADCNGNSKEILQKIKRMQKKAK